MPFPISRTSSVAVPIDTGLEVTEETVLRQVEDALRERGADRFVRTGPRLDFRSPLRMFPRGGNLNILVPISRGHVIAEMEETRVVLRYHLRFTRTVAMTSGMVFGIMGPFLSVTVEDISTLWVLVPIWLWGCGANYLVSILRIPGFLERALRPVVRKPPPPVTPPWAPGQPPRFSRE